MRHLDPLECELCGGGRVKIGGVMIVMGYACRGRGGGKYALGVSRDGERRGHAAYR